jgi:hypothetical protein
MVTVEDKSGKKGSKHGFRNAGVHRGDYIRTPDEFPLL